MKRVVHQILRLGGRAEKGQGQAERVVLCRDAWPIVTVQFKDVHFWGVRFTMKKLLHLLDEVGDEMGGLSWVASPVGEQHRECGWTSG